MSQFRRAGRSGHVIDNAPLTGGAFSIPKLIRVAGKDKLSGPACLVCSQMRFLYLFFHQGYSSDQNSARIRPAFKVWGLHKLRYLQWGGRRRR